MLVVVVHWLYCHFCSSFCCYSSFIAFQRHPSPFRGLSPGFYTHFILSVQPITEWFTTLSFSEIFFHSFTASATVLRGYFLPTGVFYLTLELHRHFTCIYQDLPGSRQFFLEVCRTSYWSSKHRPGPSVYLIHSNPQCSYSEEFIFKFYHILWWITCGKKFSLYAPYSFRTLFACSKCYVKTIITCYCLKLLRGTLF